MDYITIFCFFNRGSFRFKLKFHPDEEKVYICYPDAAKLPQISLAVAQAYVPSLTPAEAMRFVRTIAPRD